MKAPEPPKLYQRKYKDSDDVALSDLQRAYAIAAGLVAEGKDAFIPVFTRLEKEVEQRERMDAIRKRAAEVAKRFGRKPKN
ncbi:MAG: hypothetical protein EA357_11250 [Micavibrio sp.]|nr:MAG: hypothetical protein EA357_11250 [Micavibrio sp.]